MSFLGTYADFTGQAIQKFTVEGLAGRDPNGAPRWKVVCACGYPQVFAHAKVLPLLQGRASQTSLLCGSPACPFSRHTTTSETFSDFRRRERKEAEQAARLANEAQEADEAKANKERAQAAKEALIQRQYIRYLNHQWSAGQEDEKICSRQRWFGLSPGTRQIVLDAIQKDPTVRISGL